MNLKTIFGVLTSLGFLAACGGPSAQKINGTAAEFVCEDGEMKTVGIVGGKTLSQQSEAGRGIVFLFWETGEKDEQGRAKSSVCTGSLIDRNIVLTAAHCVPADLKSEKIFVAFSVNPICQISTDEGSKLIANADRVLRHELWNGKSSENDLALVRIKGQAPADRKPLKLLTHPVNFKRNQPLYVAGYGRTRDYNIEDPEAPKLRVATIFPLQSEENKNKFTTSNLKSLLYFDQSRGQGACAGDSGGPTFYKEGNELYILGVNSAVVTLGTGDFMEMKQKDVTCRQGLLNVSVYAYRNWISGAYQKLLNENSLGKQFEE